ncbi:MAG: hypothetical protein AB7F21_02235 [Desulfuromonadales bacterium]
MEKEEFYRNWEPIEGIPSELYVEALHDDYEFFRVLLKGNKHTDHMLRIFFDAHYAYRNINESFRQSTWCNFNFDTRSSLYIVENSKWLLWFHEESAHVYADEEIKHYAIYTTEDCIDILSKFPPEVAWLND